jgi:hypothetical protein
VTIARSKRLDGEPEGKQVGLYRICEHDGCLRNRWARRKCLLSGDRVPKMFGASPTRLTQGHVAAKLWWLSRLAHVRGTPPSQWAGVAYFMNEHSRGVKT